MDALPGLPADAKAARLQRRLQRYGWDLAADEYELGWRKALARVQRWLLACALLRPGERVLDVACGTGLVSFAAAVAVKPAGRVVGVDLSERMVAAARHRADAHRVDNVAFARGDAERIVAPAASFDAALCALGLMYLPDPVAALREMRRVLRPGGRVVAAVWGERSRCGWAEVFPIVDAEIESEACPLFFALGAGEALAAACQEAGLRRGETWRLPATLDYADGDAACHAVFEAGPVALAWRRFDGPTRERVRRRYLDSIRRFRQGRRYRVPAEFVVTTASVPIGDAALHPPPEGNP